MTMMIIVIITSITIIIITIQYYMGQTVAGLWLLRSRAERVLAELLARESPRRGAELQGALDGAKGACGRGARRRGPRNHRPPNKLYIYI